MIMNDKNLMEDLLHLEKGACDLYMHGTIEAPTNNVHQAFENALKESLCMQNSIYTEMENKGWYTAEMAEQGKINTLKQKFAAQQA